MYSPVFVTSKPQCSSVSVPVNPSFSSRMRSMGCVLPRSGARPAVPCSCTQAASVLILGVWSRTSAPPKAEDVADDCDVLPRHTFLSLRLHKLRRCLGPASDPLLEVALLRLPPCWWTPCRCTDWRESVSGHPLPLPLTSKDFFPSPTTRRTCRSHRAAVCVERHFPRVAARDGTTLRSPPTAI